MIVVEEGEVKMGIGFDEQQVDSDFVACQGSSMLRERVGGIWSDQVQLLCWNEVIGKGSKGEGLRRCKRVLLAVDHVGGLHGDQGRCTGQLTVE